MVDDTPCKRYTKLLPIKTHECEVHRFTRNTLCLRDELRACKTYKGFTNLPDIYLTNTQSDRTSLAKMLSLKDLAAEVIPEDVILEEQHNDIAAIIKHNRSVVKTCSHGTAWTYRRGEVNGPVTYTCGCVEQWKDGECVKDVVDCDMGVYGVGEGCIGWGCVCVG